MQRPAHWDLDSDDIASVKSEDLYANRPNRWTGAKSTWRSQTAEERGLWQSMQQISRADLSARLYHAAVLKRRGQKGDVVKQEEEKTEGEPEARSRERASPGARTAWPIEEELGVDRASTVLGEEIEAAALRLARERLRKRKWWRRAVQEEAEWGTETEAETVDEGDADVDADADVEMMDETEGDDDEDEAESDDSDTFPPVVSADDALSHQLLSPSIQHTLTTLNKTLTILHNARFACTSQHQTRSATGSETDSHSQQQRRRRRRLRGRTSSSSAAAGGDRNADESQHDFETRVARKLHRRLPRVSPSSDAAAFQAWLAGETRPATVDDDDDDDDDDGAARYKLRRWRLTDWSQVVGAAALAGFSHSVVRRAAGRCADLFGEAVLLRTLQDGSDARSIIIFIFIFFSAYTPLPPPTTTVRPPQQHDTTTTATSSTTTTTTTMPLPLPVPVPVPVQQPIARLLHHHLLLRHTKTLLLSCFGMRPRRDRLQPTAEPAATRA
ncbi:hypothetical protein XA68_16521 [Ophiocordyceps unilateralis]|uniref:Uncharacterized protein n=1 Tax=Ophiocordyceps unilateralis TaxID=268505 RepID=A0A2A9P4S4_OPHUN|nr:hypothetical protein XA68_16521 [Ophiocordyceps unilateralis]